MPTAIEKKISKELRKFEKITSGNLLGSLIQFCEENPNLTLNFNAYKKNSGYENNHWYGVSEGTKNLRGLSLEDFEVSKEYPVTMVRITDFQNRRNNFPILYMHDNRVIDQGSIRIYSEKFANVTDGYSATVFYGKFPRKSSN